MSFPCPTLLDPIKVVCWCTALAMTAVSGNLAGTNGVTIKIHHRFHSTCDDQFCSQHSFSKDRGIRCFQPDSFEHPVDENWLKSHPEIVGRNPRNSKVLKPWSQLKFYKDVSSIPSIQPGVKHASGSCNIGHTVLDSPLLNFQPARHLQLRTSCGHNGVRYGYASLDLEGRNRLGDYPIKVIYGKWGPL